MTHKIKIWVIVLLAFAPFAGLKAQMTVTPNQTAATLASQLTGPGVVITNPTLTCPSVANGLFSGATSPLSISSGIILTTGSAANANNIASFASSEDNGAAGDANLNALSGQTTFDACVLQFDFVAQGTSVKFDYQFGSEEYPQYSCTQYNDVFAFFLSGPGFATPTNLAVLPGTTTPVTINSTTGIGTCNPVHPYFINNVGSGKKPAYDGLISVLSAQANIVAGATYHLKIGIADAADGSLTSGVFLKQGSLTVGPPVVTGCPGNITSCNPIVSWTPPVGTSPGLPVTTTTNHNPGETFPVGTTVVTYTFNNGFSSSTCTFNVVVNAAPVIVSCPGNISTTTNTNNCSKAVTYTVTASGTPTPTFSYVLTGATAGSGSGTGSGFSFNRGTTTVNVSATNSCGTVHCIFTVDVTDNVAPVPNIGTLATVTGQCSATVTAPKATDNCAGAISGTTPDPLTYNAQGTYTVHWTYNDGNGNTSTQNQTVIVHDATAPVPNIASLPTVTGECAATVAAAPTATDNCSGIITATTPDPLTYSAQGNYTIHWTYNDGNGNTSTQNQTVIVHDVTAPVANLATLPTATGECSATVAAAPTATDNCSGIITGTTPDPLTYNAQGTYTIHWTYNDGNGNTSAQTQDVIVHDVTAPVADVAALSTVTGECSATIAAAPTATDNCSGAITGTTTDPLTYSAQGDYTVNWTYNDGNGNTSTQTQAVSVHDVNAPVADVAALPTVTGECSATIAAAPTATDGCAGAITGTTTDPLTYSAQGDYTVNWMYNDGNGNTSTQAQIVRVHDVTAPVADMAALPTVTGECSATVAAAPKATDNCSGAITGTTTDPLTYSQQGTYTVNWTYNDGNGNTSTQTQTVIVHDVTAPVADVTTLPTVTGECFAAVTGVPTATDNCSGSITGTTADPISYTGQGTYTVNWSYDDGNGNISHQTQTVIIHDDMAPVPDMAALPTVSVECAATVTAPTATDNCTGSITATTTDPVNYTVQGDYTINWTYNDGNGNTSTQTQVVRVHDVTAPVADMAALPNVTGQCSATVTTVPTATDNCTGTITGTTTDPLTYNAQGTYTVNWRFNDGNGNTSAQTQTVIVHDVTAPVANMAALPTVTGQCAATIAAAPTATDNCSGNITGTTSDPLTYSAQGTYTVNWTYNDGNGNTSAQTQTVIVHDVTAPVADVAALPTVSGECSATIAAAPTATDNCSGTITATTTDPLTYSTQGTFTVNWTYNDGNGNTSTQTQTVSVHDVTAPGIAGTPANIAVNNDAGICGATVTWVCPTATDNCSATIAQTAGPARGSVFPVGAPTTITYTATDIAGNTHSESFTVTVTDNEVPTITAPANVVINGWCRPVSLAAANASLGTPATHDNCAVATVTNNAPATFPVGTTTVTWTVTDSHGLTATANQTVTVNPATLTASNSVTNVSCNTGNTGNHNNGAVTTSVSGGTSPYTYAWGTGQVCANLTGLAIGTYSVTITDAHSCAATTSGTVCQPAKLTVAATAANVSCNTANGGNHANGSVTTVATGGTGTDTYMWSNAQTSANISNLTIGTYSVTVTDANSCGTTAAATVGQPTAISVTATAANISCNATNTGNHNNGTVVTVVSGGTGTDTYLWSNAQTSANISNLAVGTYSVTVTDTKGCTQTANATVGQPAAITSTITGPASVLGAVATTYTGPAGMTTYAWSVSGGNHICDSKCHHYPGHVCGSGCDHYGHPCTSACHHNANHVCANNHFGDHHCNIYCHHFAGHVCTPSCDHYGHSCTSSCHHHSNHRCGHDHCGSASVTGSATGQTVSVMSPCCSSTYALTLTTTNAAGCSSTSTLNVTSTASATITVYSTLYTTGSGWHPSTTKSAMGMDLKVYDRHNAGRRDFNQSHYSTVWNSTTNQITNATISAPTVVSIGGGLANKYVVTVPADGHYLLVGKSLISSTACTGGNCTIYTGRKVGGHDDVDGNDHDYDDDDDGDLDPCTNTVERFHAVIKDQTGKCTEADTHEEHGSLMMVITPLNLTFTDSVAFMPVIYESVEGEWGVSVSAEPPYGFFATPDSSLSTNVTDSVMNSVQFQITDTGSDWTFTKLTHTIQHKGAERIYRSKPAMVNERTNRPVEINIVPNPASSQISITMPKFEGRATIFIYDMMGRTVAQQDVKVVSGFSVNMNIASLVPGVYMVTAKNSEGKATSRLLKTQ